MNDPLCCPPVIPPTIGWYNTVQRDGKMAMLSWKDLTPAERSEITMANVNRCPVKLPESVSGESLKIRLAMQGLSR